MFGRQHDITTRDQQQSIDVPLPDDAIAAITGSGQAAVAADFNDSALMQDDGLSLDDHLSGLSSAPDENTAEYSSAPTVSAQKIAVKPATPPRRLSSGDLLDIKRAALGELSPIIDVLDGKPEEKFRTIIELIQSTDNQALLPAALAIAKEIPDRQIRAHALLAIINETNYFTKYNAGL